MASPSLLVTLAKRLINRGLSPTWCTMCGERLSEQPIGYREQGSHYSCMNSYCHAFGLSLALASAERNRVADENGDRVPALSGT